MPDHQLIVARGFRTAGVVIGLPSFLGAISLGAGAFLTGSGPAHRPQHLDISTYGLVGLISNAADGVGGVLSFLNGIAAWAFGLLAVLSLAVALFGGLLYVVGRGLSAGRPWARMLAIVTAGFLAFNSFVGLAVARGGARLADAIVLAALAYVLWVLLRRFGQPISDARVQE